MPYQQEYIPAPTDFSLKVVKDKPEGHETDFAAVVKQIFDMENGDVWHFCPKCDGWIRGKPNQFEENTLGPLCGRQGTTSHCARCGYEINFSGMMR
jgi:predicted RNA-binding Zn-ribbon protein involved in translation (DUF1610 family)